MINFLIWNCPTDSAVKTVYIILHARDRSLGSNFTRCQHPHLIAPLSISPCWCFLNKCHKQEWWTLIKNITKLYQNSRNNENKHRERLILIGRPQAVTRVWEGKVIRGRGEGWLREAYTDEITNILDFCFSLAFRL